MSGGTADVGRQPHHAFITLTTRSMGATPHAHHRPHQDLTSAS